MLHLVSSKLVLPVNSLPQKHWPANSVPARLNPADSQYATHLVLVTWFPIFANVIPVRTRALRLSEKQPL